MGVFTFTPSVGLPRRRIFPTVPSSTASNSMVACVGLDLGEIVARGHLVALLQPDHFREGVPSSMVGERAGHEYFSRHHVSFPLRLPCKMSV